MSQKKTKAKKVKPVQYNCMTLDKTMNGYILAPYNTPGRNPGCCNGPEYAFETDVALFKFLRKHFCEGYK